MRNIFLFYARNLEFLKQQLFSISNFHSSTRSYHVRTVKRILCAGWNGNTSIEIFRLQVLQSKRPIGS